MTKQPLHAVSANNTPTAPNDAGDIEALLMDPALGDGITNVTYQRFFQGAP